jgi:hypothetical protein
MRVSVLLGLAGLTLPYYGHAADPPAAAAASVPENVRTITLDPTARRPVCKRFVPTGSRIAERRCETPPTTAQAEADRATLRRDFQAMRDQQMLRDQARQAASAEALRRRGGQ